MMKTTTYTILMTLFFSMNLTAVEWKHEKTDLDPDPAIRFGTLENGMGYVLRPSKEPPQRISVRLLVQAGSLMETEEQRGLAHFLEHMAFNGTRNFPPGEMVEYFQRLGMAFGADTNASTGFDRTIYKLELPSGDAQLREESLLLLRDYSDGILFLEEEIEKERGIILAEKASRDTVGFRTFQNEIAFLLPDSPFPERMPIGLEQVIREVPRDEFIAFYEKWYHPQRTVIVVTGDFDPDAWESSIKEAFATFGEGRGDAPENPDLGELIVPEIRASVYNEPDASVARFELSAVLPMEGPSDSVAVRERQMRMQILHSMLSRRLQRLSEREDSPILSSYSYTEPFFQFAEISGIAATVEPKNWEEAVRIIEQQLRNALTHGFSESEWTEASRRLLQEIRQKVAAEDSKISRQWADELSSQINQGRVPISAKLELEIYNNLMETDQGPEAVEQLLREVWVGQGRGLFLTGSFGDDPPTADELLAVYEESLESPIDVDDMIAAIEFPYVYTEEAEPVKRELVEDLDITQLTYENKVRVNLKPTTFERDTIYVHLRFGSGASSIPEDQPGLVQMAEGAFMEGGLGEISMDELRSIIAGHAIDMRFTVLEGGFELQGKTNREDALFLMSILRAYLEDAGYRAEGFRLFERSIGSMYRDMNSQWQGVLHSQVWPYLYGNTEAHRFPTEEELRQRTYEELRQWLKEPLAQSYLEVTLVGDFDVDTMIGYSNRILGTISGPRQSQPEPLTLTPPVFPAGESKHFSVTSGIPQGLAMVVWPVQGIRPVQQSRVLSLLSSVYQDRLRLLIREESGQAYSYSAGNRPSWVYDYGLWFGLAVLQPELVDPVGQSLFEIAISLMEQPISEDEMDRALIPTLKSLRDMMRTNPYWLRSLSGSQADPDQLDWVRTIMEGYEAISLEDLQSAASEWLLPEKATHIQIKTPLESSND